MNGPSKLSLAIALALIGGNAFALGLGSIQVKSGLNQPLDAEIAVTTETPGEAAGINVSMATAEDFDRVGLNRARVNVPIDFAVSTNSRGQAVIRLTTKEAVREPFLDFLVQVNWPKGKLLREYTVLLDPPVTAPAVRGAPATVTPAKEPSAAPSQKLVVEEKQTKSKATTVKPPKSAAAEPKQPAPAKPAPAPKSTPAPTRTAAAGDYGPVAEGETLSEVARATRPDEATNINQMMLALLKANPNAFYKDNINALKRGAILRIPSGEELKANGNAAAAAAAVREQNDAWGSGAAVAKPTVVATTGAPKTSPAPKAEPKGSGKANEHLALVPPRAGKESQANADRPGPSSGTGAGADTKAELARTKEALASREQEATELKSRVKQLEDLNGKDQRLLSLKESEIADLQAKLKELQSKSAAASATTKPTTAPTTTATTAPATTAGTKPADTSTKPADTSGKTEPKLTAQDIWGNIAATEKAGTTKPATSATTPSTTTPSSSTTPATTGTSGTTPATTPSSTATTSSTTPSTTPGTTPSTTPGAATGTPPPSTTTSSTTPPSSTTTSTGTTVTPVTTPTTSAPTSLTTTTPSSTAANTTPAKPTTPAATPKPVTPPPSTTVEQPWYQNNTVLLAGGVGLLLIGVLTLLRFMRKPKPVLMPVEGGADLEEQAMHTGDEEHHLLDALAQSPGDAHLSLELLNLYYSQRDAAKFEAAAEAMYAHIADPTQPEWQQVKAMGEELCPHNPLFSRDVGLGGGHEDHTVFGHYDTGTGSAAQDDAFDLGGHDGHDVKHAAAEDNFDFDLTDHAAAAAPAHDLGFTHEPPPAPPPPVTVRAPVAAPAPVAVPAPAAPPAPKPAEDFFAGEDAIGTKLDLAKAYLDMGDPEGARSMLDEVMSEGNDAQKGEARKLLAEIR